MSPSFEEASQDWAPARGGQYVCIIADHINPADKATTRDLLSFWIGDPATQCLRETLQRNYLKWPAGEVPHRCWEWIGDSERIVHGSHRLVGVMKRKLSVDFQLIPFLFPTSASRQCFLTLG